MKIPKQDSWFNKLNPRYESMCWGMLLLISIHSFFPPPTLDIFILLVVRSFFIGVGCGVLGAIVTIYRRNLRL